MFLLSFVTLMAQVTNAPPSAGQSVGPHSPTALVNVLAPLLAIFVTFVIGRYWSRVPKLYVPFIAVAISTALDYFGNLMVAGNPSFGASVSIGLVTVTLREFMAQISTGVQSMKNGQPLPKMSDHRQ